MRGTANAKLLNFGEIWKKDVRKYTINNLPSFGLRAFRPAFLLLLPLIKAVHRVGAEYFIRDILPAERVGRIIFPFVQFQIGR